LVVCFCVGVQGSWGFGNEEEYAFGCLDFRDGKVVLRAGTDLMRVSYQL
jgi:hypothetical protein